MMLPFSHYWWPLCTLCKYLLSLVRVGYVELDIHYAKRVCLSTALQPNASLLFRQDPTKYHNSTSHLAADACYIPCKLYFWVFEARTLSFFSKIHVSLFCHIIFSKTLPKAQRTRGLSSAYQSNLSGHITSSNTNLDQISPSKYRPRINFKISTTHQHLD